MPPSRIKAMITSKPAQALGALTTFEAARAAMSALNKKVQEKNIKAGKAQSDISEAMFGKHPGRLNESLKGGRTLTGGPEDNVSQFQNYTPQQTGLMNRLGSLGETGINNLVNQQSEGFGPIAEEARRKFHQETVPTIAERFTSQFGAGSNRSGAFAQQLGSAARDLEYNLASLKSQYGLQQQQFQGNLYGNLLGLGLKPQFENAFLGGSGQNGPGGNGVIDKFNPGFQDMLDLINAADEGKGAINSSTANNLAIAAGLAAPVAGAAIAGSVAPTAAKAGTAAAAKAGITAAGMKAALAAGGLMAATAIPFLAVKGYFGRKYKRESAEAEANAKPKFWRNGEKIKYDETGSVIYPPDYPEQLEKFASEWAKSVRSSKEYIEKYGKQADLNQQSPQQSPQGSPEQSPQQSPEQSPEESPEESEEDLAEENNEGDENPGGPGNPPAPGNPGPGNPPPAAPAQPLPKPLTSDVLKLVGQSIPGIGRLVPKTTTQAQAAQREQSAQAEEQAVKKSAQALFDRPDIQEAIKIVNNPQNYTPEQLQNAQYLFDLEGFQKASRDLGYITNDQYQKYLDDTLAKQALEQEESSSSDEEEEEAAVAPDNPPAGARGRGLAKKPAQPKRRLRGGNPAEQNKGNEPQGKPVVSDKSNEKLPKEQSSATKNAGTQANAPAPTPIVSERVLRILATAPIQPARPAAPIKPTTQAASHQTAPKPSEIKQALQQVGKKPKYERVVPIRKVSRKKYHAFKPGSVAASAHSPSFNRTIHQKARVELKERLAKLKKQRGAK